MYLTKESLCGNSKSKFILIKDNKSNSGLKLLKTILKLFSKETPNVHLLSFDCYPENILAGLNIECNKINIFNAFSNSIGWLDSGSDAVNLMSIDYLLKTYLEYKGILCIYSLTPLLINNSVDEIYRMLHVLLNKNKDLQLLALLHSDVHDSLENILIEKLASTLLCLLPDKEDHMLTTVHYNSGKVSTQLVEYKISKSFEFISISDVNILNKFSPLKQPDPTVNLTFNLKLKDDEKEARNQIQLPYMKMQTDDEITIQNLIENEYYDEEDPDDDLDI